MPVCIAGDINATALLDSGAYSNYISLAWLEMNNLTNQINPVEGEYIQLGGTNNRLPVLGRISLETTLGNESAQLSYVVFQSGRSCIIGLESLVLHFLDTFQEKLQALKEDIHRLGHIENLNEILKLFPKEPGKLQPDPADFATELQRGEEIMISDGTQDLASEEDTAEEELKEVFAIPDATDGLSDELLDKIVGEDLKDVVEHNTPGKPFHPYFRMREVLRSNLGRDCHTYKTWTGLKYPPIKIHMLDGAPQCLHARVRNVPQALYEPSRNSLKNQIRDGMLRQDMDTSYTSAIVVVPKPRNPEEPRICGDYVPINKIIQHRSSVVPDPKKLLDTFKNFKFYYETDWIKGFHQIPLDEASQKLLAIATSLGTLVPKFLPMGVQPASGILAHIAREIFGGLGDFVISVQDNLLVGGNTLEELFDNVVLVMIQAVKFNVKLSPTQTRFGVRQIGFFGYIIGYGKYWVNPDRQSAVAAIEFPTTLKKLQHFLGLALFISPFIANYSELTAPLTGLANEKTEWKTVGEWQGKYLGAFNKVKEAVAQATALNLPELEAEWILRVDASDVACGGTLLQRVKMEGGEYELQPIAYTSHKFSTVASSWSVLEKELYALVFSLQKLDYYLRLRPFTAETDHSNILYLQQTLIPKLIRWKLFIHSYQMTLRHIPGRTNVVADALSRLYNLVVKRLDSAQLNLTQAMGHTYETIATGEQAEMYEVDCVEDINALSVVPGATIPKEVWQECHVRAHGHRGAKRTYNEMGRRYPEVRIPMDIVQQLVDACIFCQKYKSDLQLALKTARHVLTAEHHRAQVSVDVAGMETDSEGNNTCFIMVNHNTKLIYLYPAKGKDEIFTIHAVLSYIGLYGLMDKILSDPGGEFTGTFAKKLMAKLGVTWDLSITERPQSHGTERTVGRALEAVRILLAQNMVDAGSDLDWSDPAVLSVTSYLLNSEVNEETGFSAFDLVFGKGDCKDLPDISGVTGKTALTEYTDALGKHLNEVRAQANARRLARQQQRLQAGTPPGNHEYQKDDLVFVHDNGAMRSRKFMARQLGPYAVVSQASDGKVTLKSLVDGKQINRHHNHLRIFEGSIEEATKLARLDNKEILVQSITGFRGSVYHRMQTRWQVVWQDNTTTWEDYRLLENCIAMTEYANTIPFLKHRFSQTGEEFKEWSKKMNRLSHETLSTGQHGFYPILDPQLNNPFALAIQYWDASNELQEATANKTPDGHEVKDNQDALQMMQDISYYGYLTAHVIKFTKSKVDVFVPALSTHGTYRKFPANSAYVKSMTPAEILQFARKRPTNYKSIGNMDREIEKTTFRQLVWPQHWNPKAYTREQAIRPLQEVEQQEGDDEEILKDGLRTGHKAHLTIKGKSYLMTIGQQYPDGEYLCVFDSTQNTIKVPVNRLDNDTRKVLQRRKEGEKRKDGQ